MAKGCMKRSSRSPTTMVDEWNGGGCEFLERVPGYPYIEFGARAHTKQEVLLTEGS